MSLDSIFGPTPSICVLGVGNLLLGDEGLGVHAINYLKDTYNFSPEVNLVEGGTMGMELLIYLKGAQKVLLLDAIDTEGSPGELLHFTHSELDRFFTKDISAHEIGVQDILLINSLGDDAEQNLEVSVIGMIPESLEASIQLSPRCQDRFDQMIEEVLKQLKDWGITSTLKESSHA